MEIESILNRAEELKQKSFYLQSLKLFKTAFRRYRNYDVDGMLQCMLPIGDIYRMLGNFDLAEIWYSEAADLARKYRKMILFADAQLGLALSLRAQGKWKKAIKLIHSSIREYRKEGDREGFAFSLWAEAGALRIKGRILEAIKTFRSSLKMFKVLKNTQGVGFCLCGLGGTTRVAGRFRDSLNYYSAANNLFSNTKDTFGLAYSFCGTGNAFRMIGDYRRALINFKKATRLYNKIGDRVSYSYTLWSLGTTYKMMGEIKKAHDNFIKSMGIFKKTKDPRGIIYCKLGLGELCFLEGEKTEALRLLKEALYESEQNGFDVEKCHAKTIISFTDRNFDKRCYRYYNRLGLKLKFQGLPLNIP